MATSAHGMMQLRYCDSYAGVLRLCDSFMGQHLVCKSVPPHEHDILTDPTELRQFASQMLTGLTELEGKNSDLEDKHASLEARHKAEIQNRDMMITKLRHQLFGLRKDKFGSASEGLDQLGLKLEDEETGQEQTAASLEPIDDAAPSKSKPVRRSLPDHLPRTDINLTPDAPCAGCGADLDDSAKTLGEDVMEELEYVPGRFVVNPICRPRLSCAS